MTTITKIEPKKKNIEQKQRVAAYCRVSTNKDDQLESLDAQREHYEQVIKNNDHWTFAGIYYDEGLSAMQMKTRPKLMKMLNDCKQGKIDLVLVKSISRLSRNVTDYLSIIRDLNSRGIGLYFERENINTLKEDDEFMLSVLSSLAESELVSISENEKWSIKRRFMNGTYKQSMAPYGYVMKDGELVVDENTAPVVRFIFNEVCLGKGIRQITRELNAKKIPSRRTDHWSETTIKGMLQNERYIGEALYQKTFTDDNFKRHTNRGYRDQYLHNDHHPAIVTREQFDKAQELLALHRKEKGIDADNINYRERYTFSGKLICGQCGSHLKRRVITGRNREKCVVWTCATHLSNAEKCSMKGIQEEAIKSAFTTVVNKLIISKNDLLIPFVKAERECDGDETQRIIKGIERALYENSNKTQKLATLVADGLLDPVKYRQAMNELSAERNELIGKKEILVNQLQNTNLGISEGGELLKRIRQKEVTAEFDDVLFTACVKTVHIYSREEFGFEFTCGLTFREVVNLK